MKNKVCIILAAVFLLLAGCSQKADKDLPRNGSNVQTGGTKKLQIVTTIFPPYDFAQQIGQDRAEITMLLKPGMESHSYEPTPADMIRIMNSDIFLYAGGESDVWVEQLLEGNGGHTQAYALLDWVEALEEETVEGMQVKGHDHDGGQEEHHVVHLEETEYDEHVWTSPQNAMVIVGQICKLMSQKDPDNAAFYESNAEDYEKKLKELDRAFQNAVHGAVRKTLIFGDRFPLLYFVKTYGLDYYAAFPGCSMETEPSAATIAFLTDKCKEERIPVVFQLEMSNGKIAQAIAEASGASTAVFFSGHSITAEDLAAGENYLSLMYRNVETLKKALRE